jgi:hypothetical protein
MDLLMTRKILADAAGTGTAQTEVRIVDLNAPLNSHLFGLQVRFTSSPTMSAGTAAQNIINALPDIRYRLNAAVGAVSGTAEILPAEAPVIAESKVTLEQVAAIVILVLVTIFTTCLTIYLSLQRRKKIEADKREFDAQEAEKEARRLEASKKDNKEKKPRGKRQSTVLGGQKRKDRTYMQAENDAAGLEFTDTFFEMEDFPISPRAGFDDHGQSMVDLDYDPTERIDGKHDPESPPTDDGPRIITMDLKDGPGVAMELHDGPGIALDLQDGPSLSSNQSRTTHLDDGPSIAFDDGPAIPLDLDDGPKLGLESFDDAPSIPNDKPSPTINDGPSLSLDDGPSLQMGTPPLHDTSGPSLNDGPSLRMSDPAPSSSPSKSSVPPLSITSSAYDSGTDSDSGLSTPNRKRPSAVPRLNLNLGSK